MSNMDDETCVKTCFWVAVETILCKKWGLQYDRVTLCTECWFKQSWVWANIKFCSVLTVPGEQVTHGGCNVGNSFGIWESMLKKSIIVVPSE